MTTGQKRIFNALDPGPYQAQQAENADLTYIINWLSDVSNDISTSVWTVVAGTATLSNKANTTIATTVRITANVGFARIVNKVTYANGEVDERIIKLTVKDNENGIPNDYGMI